MDEMTTITNRQWPDNLIMPATARHRLEFWYYGEAEQHVKKLMREGWSQRDIVDRVVGWIMQQVDDWPQTEQHKCNRPVFALIARNDVGRMAEGIYHK